MSLLRPLAEFSIFHSGQFVFFFGFPCRVFCLYVDLVRLSLPVEVIDWKELSLRNDVGTLKPYSLTP